jgi:hypothetical protein
MHSHLTRSLVGYAVLVTGLALAVPETACSSSPSQEPGGAGGSASEEVSVGIRLTLPDGSMITSVSYTVTGPNGASTVVKTGTVAVGSSLSLSFSVPVTGLTSGDSYAIALSGDSSDASDLCTASTQFTAPKSSVPPIIKATLVCQPLGSAQIDAPLYDCPSSVSLSASPSETSVGASVALSAMVTAVNPSGITYSWSAPSGSFSASTAANTNFTCAVSGVVTVTLTAGDGPVPDGGSCSPASSTLTIPITCGTLVDAGSNDATGG